MSVSARWPYREDIWTFAQRPLMADGVEKVCLQGWPNFFPLHGSVFRTRMRRAAWPSA